MADKKTGTLTQPEPPRTPDVVPQPNGTAPKRKRKTAPVNPNETKAEKFRRLRNHRMPRALRLIAALKNLSNRSQYEFTAEEAAEIYNELGMAVQGVKTAYTTVGILSDGWKSKVS